MMSTNSSAVAETPRSVFSSTPLPHTSASGGGNSTTSTPHPPANPNHHSISSTRQMHLPQSQQQSQTPTSGNQGSRPTTPQQPANPNHHSSTRQTQHPRSQQQQPSQRTSTSGKQSSTNTQPPANPVANHRTSSRQTQGRQQLPICNPRQHATSSTRYPTSSQSVSNHPSQHSLTTRPHTDASHQSSSQHPALHTDPPAGLSSGDIMHLVTMQQKTLTKVNALEQHITRMEKVVAESLQELKKMIDDQQKQSFSLKASGYEADLKYAMASLFCKSLTRYPKDEEINIAIRGVLSRQDYSKKHIISIVKKGCKDMLSTFRTEERRKILGLPLYEKLCYRSTLELCSEVLTLFKTPANSELESIYMRHLAILRKYVRENPGCRTALRFHENAKKWINEHYGLEPSDDQWAALLIEDEQHPYSSYPITSCPLPHVEEQFDNSQENDDMVYQNSTDMYPLLHLSEQIEVASGSELSQDTYYHSQ